MIFKPEISVLMSVYNAEQYLEKAIESILNQSFKNFEFLIINDASDDNSLNIINRFQDHRLHVYSNPVNLGLANSLNKGINLSQGKYIARMDADDIAVLSRLAIQYTFLEKNPHIDICGASVRLINESGEYLPDSWTYPETHE
jgi:glycosyltransferase involved in cell wall biosynthesis